MELRKVAADPKVTPGKALKLPIHVTLPRLTSGKSDKSHAAILGSEVLHAHLGSLRQVMTLHP